MGDEIPRTKTGTSTERFVLILIVVALLQYIVTGWVGRYGTSTEIVGQVSFAGTIVGIILAVLAIVYTYYQSFSQQRDANTIATQLAALEQVVREARHSKTDLANEIDRITELSDKLDTTIALSTAAKDAMAGVAASVEELKRRANQQAVAQLSNADVGTVVPHVMQAIIKTATALQLAVYYALVEATRRKMTSRAAGEVIKTAVKAKRGAEYALVGWFDGIFSGTWYLLHTLGLLRIAKVTKGGVQFTGIDPEFARAVEEAAKEDTREPAPLDVAHLRDAFAALDARSVLLEAPEGN